MAHLLKICEDPVMQSLYSLALEKYEPILQDNPDRFVVFPIIYKDIWEYYQKAKASFWTPQEVSLNDEKCYFLWPGEEQTDCDCDSSSLNALETPLREDETIITIDVVTARGEVEIVQQPNAGNDYTAVIEFDDHVDGQFPGSDMYEIIINYN